MDRAARSRRHVLARRPRGSRGLLQSDLRDPQAASGHQVILSCAWSLLRMTSAATGEAAASPSPLEFAPVPGIAHRSRRKGQLSSPYFSCVLVAGTLVW